MSLFEVTGTVVRGKRNGTKMGLPTANLVIQEGFTAKPGVYGGVAVVNNQSYIAAICVGTQPMTGVTNIEAHFLDGTFGDLYDEEITLTATMYLREMKKYATVYDLEAAIRQDIVDVRREVMVGK